LPTGEIKPVLELALTLARGDMGVLMLHDDTIGELRPAIGIGIDDDQMTVIGAHRSGVGPFGRALSTHRRVRVRDAWHDPRALPDLAQQLGYRSLEILPLFDSEGRAIGAMAVMFRRGQGNHRRGQRLVNRCAQVLVSAVLQAQRASAADQARQAAEQVGHAKVQFLARMSHELRTPLQSIAGYLELLRVDASDPLSPSQLHQVERMRASSQILVHVIDDLITYSQLESGYVTYRLVKTSANEALRIAEGVVRPLAIARGVQVDLVTTTESMFVNGDPDRLHQILVNLAANAVKFTHPGGRVTLTCRAESGSIYFDVSDTGPGIPADRIATIFEPYVQLATPHAHLGGSGLGLAISREFAAGMQGRLTVRSVVGSGSVFTLELPSIQRDIAVLPANALAPSSSHFVDRGEKTLQ
jgi:signal transduction histidine kinase